VWLFDLISLDVFLLTISGGRSFFENQPPRLIFRRWAGMVFFLSFFFVNGRARFVKGSWSCIGSAYSTFSDFLLSSIYYLGSASAGFDSDCCSTVLLSTSAASTVLRRLDGGSGSYIDRVSSVETSYQPPEGPPRNITFLLRPVRTSSFSIRFPRFFRRFFPFLEYAPFFL